MLMPFRNVPFAFPVLLVEYTGRLFRAGKAVISGDLAGVFERLGVHHLANLGGCTAR